MEHIYHLPQFGENWFNYQGLYSEMVKKFSSGSHFVEVGSWKGKSSSFMAVEIINSGKQILFDCVDTWEGGKEHQGDSCISRLFEIFQENMEPLEGYYNAIKMKSMEAVKLYEDESIDFIFIDASHEYEDIKDDISNWILKLRGGGIIAGHDYGFIDVKKAVNEILGCDNIKRDSDCWVYYKS